ncbi:MAG: MarC family protein [Chitinophagales bacterium]|nr:MarC family protein [Chitinophagales bacterium]MDW8273605.1 MarC family protein [Chitinophagales bacterium]
MKITFGDIVSVTFSLFAVIDMVGNIPIILGLKRRQLHFHPATATLFAGLLMIVFLFAGEAFLKLMGVDVQSFAIAGSIVIFILGIEMIIGRSIFKTDPEVGKSGSIVPLAFPLIAGAGTLTTVISLRAVYSVASIVIGILINLVIIYVTLRSIGWIEKKLSRNTLHALNKFFGVILIAIAVKIFTNAVLSLSKI